LANRRLRNQSRRFLFNKDGNGSAVIALSLQEDERQGLYGKTTIFLQSFEQYTGFGISANE